METVFFAYGFVFIAYCLSRIVESLFLSNNDTEAAVKQEAKDMFQNISEEDVATQAQVLGQRWASINKLKLALTVIDVVWIIIGLVFSPAHILFCVLIFLLFVALPLLRMTAGATYSRYVYSVVTFLMAFTAAAIVNGHFNFF